jgi:DNA-binding GntR family transcriptional regulator
MSGVFDALGASCYALGMTPTGQAPPQGEPSRRLRPVSLREQAREAVRARIVLGQIAPGEVQSVVSVAGELGVSITPVREAIMDLANLGMVEIIRNRGFRVPVLTEHDLDEIYTLRTMLEVPAMRRLPGMLGRKPLPEFHELAQRITDAAHRGDLVEFVERDREFHLGLLGLLDNGRLVTTVAQLRDQVRMQGLQKLADQGELTHSGREHIAIVAAIEANDPERTAELMERHLLHSQGIWAGRSEDT